ncbi:hypothetical protein ACH3VR_17975 [Microbacterium sp. B2969]|uniref:Uncharacterized protein n=1 Tax=Microbacterium alkaliflavum TaxID=3248839 RepID=A0ABW7QBN4_9MICO
MRRRHARGRCRSALAGGLLVVLAVSGCAPTPSPDPALVSLSQDALSYTRSAILGVDQEKDGLMFRTTATALLGDMETKLADLTREVALHRPADAEDAAYRTELLDASMASLDAVQAAVRGGSGAEARLERAADRLAELGSAG